MTKAAVADYTRAGPVRIVRLNPALVCLLLGVLGVLPLVVLTPPFQVPDESQHFLRAYQLSEFRLGGVVEAGETKVLLPTSLPELIERFLGTRAILAERPVTAQPIGRTWRALAQPLAAEKREPVTIEYTSYPPLPYLPQAFAIAVGKSLGAGPLALLYLARLTNALVAVGVLAWAMRLLPVGGELAMVFGLLPMAIYEYASVSPDAAMITTALLFTALTLRCQLRGRWSLGDVALAATTGLIFCVHKPVYAPLLLVGVPAALRRERTKHVLLVHLVIVTIVGGATFAWWRFGAVQSASDHSNIASQVAFIAEHPLNYLETTVISFFRQFFYYKSTIGALGWLTISLPGPAYVLPVCGVLLGTLVQPRNSPRLPRLAVAWNIILLAAASELIMTAAYLMWNNVGSPTIETVQGRYFLPLLALAAAAWCSVVKPPLLSPRASLVCAVMLVAVIVVEFAMTDFTIVRAYRVF